MIISCGDKHKGESVAEVLIKDASYVKYVLSVTETEGLMTSIRDEMIRLINIFNSKPFLQNCWGDNHKCGEVATGATAYKEDYIGLYWWCNDCDPYQSGASMGTLHAITSYEDVLKYVYMVLNNNGKDSEALIKRLAQEKGLPKRLSKGGIEKFFLPEGDSTV